MRNICSGDQENRAGDVCLSDSSHSKIRLLLLRGRSREENGETTALAKHAGDLDSTAMRFNKRLDNEQPEPGALLVAIGDCPTIPLKDLWEFFQSDAAAGVSH